MRVLLHVCCAPCLLAPLEALRAESLEPAGFFYNPNIHPFLEFRKRIKALHVFRESDDMPLEIISEYGLDRFIREAYLPALGARTAGAAQPDRGKRCENCYLLRLRATALRAREQGFDCFTTTLLVSPHQKHDLVRHAGERVAAETATRFLYRDFRPLNERSHRLARQRMLYRQSYCGCCFSEYERYRDTTRELYRGRASAGNPEGSSP